MPETGAQETKHCREEKVNKNLYPPLLDTEVGT